MYWEEIFINIFYWFDFLTWVQEEVEQFSCWKSWDTARSQGKKKSGSETQPESQRPLLSSFLPPSFPPSLPSVPPRPAFPAPFWASFYVLASFFQCRLAFFLHMAGNILTIIQFYVSDSALVLISKLYQVQTLKNSSKRTLALDSVFCLWIT